MASEEKEPYFDGPLVTPPTAQSLFYPGSNPQNNFIPAAATAGGFQQAAGPAFYNPNDFMQGGAGAGQWGSQAVQEPRVQNNIEQEPRQNINAVMPGTQAYFGGIDGSSSASSSQQTSPEHLLRPKSNDIPGNPAPYEPQIYSPHPATLFTPQVDGATPQNLILNSGASEQKSSFSPPEHNMHNSAFPPGGTSGQHSYAHPQAAPFFVPNSGPVNQEVQNYMNPVPHNNPTPPTLFSSHLVQSHDLQSTLQEKNISADDDEAVKNEAGSPLNPVDLHNGAPDPSDPGGDRSYMNMAYNYEYSGVVPAQGANAYAGHGFHAEGSSMMIPPSSGHDYDILHSQGTWEEQNYGAHAVHEAISQVPVSDALDIPPQEEKPQISHSSDVSHGLEGEVLEGASAAFISPTIEDASLPTDGQDETVAASENAPHEENASRQNLDAEPDNAEGKDVPQLHDLTVGNRIHLSSDVTNQDVIYTSSEASPDQATDMSELHKTNQEAEDSTLSLDYNNGSGSSNLQDLQVDAGYVYHGPITSVNEDNQVQQSYANPLPDLGAKASLPPDIATQEQLPPVSIGNENEPGPSLNTANNEETHVISDSPESPIPADGLHPKSSAPEQTYSESPHHFASPNSAFESRIRSQSTGSNNSNASSQRSSTNQPLRNVQNRSVLPPYSAASLEIPSSTRQETVPTSNPFNTNTMHSSHISDPSASQPSSTVPLVHSAIPPIPDIVRPLPSASGDENLRTGATVPFSSTNHSLHSQVVRNRTAYPPEPVAGPPQSVASTSGRPQPDLIQSPPEVASVQLRTSAEASDTVMALKTSEAPPLARPDVSAVTTSGVASVTSDPYLSRSLRNSSLNLAPTSTRNHDSIPQQVPAMQSLGNEQSPESSLPVSARTDDLHQREGDDHHHSEVRRHDEDPLYSEERDQSYRHGHDDDSRRGSKDSRWDDRRRHEDEYRRRDYDDRYSHSGRWESRDDRYRDGRYDDPSRSRSEHNSRPASRQSNHPESYYPRHYDERYDRGYRDSYYRDRYYNDRYQDYDGRQYYRYDDRDGDRYYDPHHTRYQDSWHERGRQYYDQYYYDSYYHDHRYRDQRHHEEEDSRSIYSERSRATEHEPSSEREWHSRRGYHDQYEYGYGQDYDSRYYEDSLADESTLSNAYAESWQRLPQVPARQTPAKFTTTHTIARFGPGGQLIKVQPNRPTDNQPSTVEIHSLEILLQNTDDAEDLRSYPGPLTKEDTHKNDVLQFSSARSAESMKDFNLTDRRSTALIWDFLALLVRQNGSVLGTDIAELLTKDHSGDFTLMQSPLEASRQRQLQLQQRTATPNSISDDQAGGASPGPEQSETKSTISTLSAEVGPTMERNTSRFRELLLHGRKKDALEWAMKSGLWGHALLLASKMDSRTHAQVMLRFANSLPINDPLQTVYQLMSGRQPAAATCVSEEGWGDWRPHLAMMLSNPTTSASLDMRAVLTMGDTLSTRGLLHAAHFCYLMSSTPLGYYGRPASKIVLLGGNHLLPFTDFASWDSIRRTEIYEYAITLGKPQKPGSAPAPSALPAFQLYKLIYACKLAEYGLVAQAFHYCEWIGKAIYRSPSSYSPTLVNQLVNISDQLRHHDPQIQAGVSEASSLKWLETLRTINNKMQSGAIVPRTNVPSSLITTSNTPSVVSTSPTTDSQNDEIRFSAHSPEQDDSEDVMDSGMRPPQDYDHNAPQVTMYSTGEPPIHAPSVAPPSMVPDTGLDQNYGQEQNQIPMHDPNISAMTGGYQQQPHFTQPTMSGYTQPQVPMGNFGQLADQANPLTTGFAPPPVPNQMQNMYGNTMERPRLTADEEAERTDHYDYYDQMANTHKINHSAARSRTISQSSQRSRGSTIKGYDRTSPTGMMNSIDKGRRSRTTSENSAGRRSRKTSGEKQKRKDEMEDSAVKKSGSWSLLGWFSRRRSNQAHLPDDSDKAIYYDNDKQRWVNKNATEEENAPVAPPPMDNSLSNPTSTVATQQPSTIQNGGAGQPIAPSSGDGQLTANRFSLKNLGGGNRSMYKNAFSSSSKPVSATPPADLLPVMPNLAAPKPSGFMIPNPVPASQPTNVHDQDPAATSTPMHSLGAPQSSIQSPSVAAAPESDNAPAGPTMFFNPSQFSAPPDLLSQPPAAGHRGNALTRRGRGRPGYPGRR